MRPAPPAPAPTRRLGIALVLVALAACGRDLALPSPPTSPTVTGFSPAAAFAGQLVRVTGTHFAADAASNTVNFARASARAERLEGGVLVVRVPGNAGDGPITVSNQEGTSSASAGPFSYLGLGEPARLQVASKTPILHQPRAVYPVAGDVVLDSGLYEGLVWKGNYAFKSPQVSRSAASPERGLVYHARTNSFAGPMMEATNAATGTTEAWRFLPDVPLQILPIAGQDLLVTFHDGGASPVVRGWRASDLTEVFPASPFGLDDFWGAADVRDGRVVVAAFDYMVDFALKLYLLDFSGGGRPKPPEEFACGIGFLGPCPPPLATDATGTRVPLAVARDAAASIRAAAALDDGNLVIADFGGLGPEYSWIAETFNAEPIEAIAAGTSAGAFVATKPAAGYALGVGAGGDLLWIVDMPAPTVATVVTQPGAMGSVDLAYLAGNGDNDAVIVNVTTGQKIGRINFDVRPESTGPWAGAATQVPSTLGLGGDVLFSASAYPALIRVPTGGGSPTIVDRTDGIEFLTTSTEAGGSRVLWVASAGATPLLDAYADYHDGEWTTALAVALPAAPQRVAARGSVAVVAHDEGLSVVDAASPPPGVPPTAAIPGSTYPLVSGLGFTDAGDVWVLVDQDDFSQVVQLWSLADVTPGGAPLASWTVPGTALSAALLEDGLWVFQLDDTLAPVATRLDAAALQPDPAVPSNGRITEIHGISPNGRLLVVRESGSALGFVLRFFRADGADGFPEVGSLGFTERVEAFTFDSTGERLYVLTQNPDRIVTVD